MKHPIHKLYTLAGRIFPDVFRLILLVISLALFVSGSGAPDADGSLSG